jgi:membrane protease YdiL (CAAX protease family)
MTTACTRSPATNRNTPILESSRLTSWWVILAVIAGNSALDVALMTDPSANVLRSIVRSTHGLVLPSLAMCTIELAVIVVGVVFLVGRLRWSDVGIDKRRILPGITFVAGFWFVVQLVTVGSNLAAGEPLALHPQWMQRPAHTVGRVFADWLGVAIYEEVVFRGFLLTQLWLHCSRWLRGRRWIALGAAGVLSQSIFALGHIPYLMMHRGIDPATLPADMLHLFGMGVLFSVVYLSTRNLLFAVAVHAMINAPALLCQAPDAIATPAVVLLAMVFVVPLALLHRVRSRTHS